MMASTGDPAPQAIPTAAVAQIDAAVVRPDTLFCRTKISPAPRKPIPETICAAIRDGSKVMPSLVTVLKPYAETSVKTADPTPTRVCVRIPALLSFR